MALGSFVKTIRNIMRGDAGINGDAQRIEQMTWMLFLKVYDEKESTWEFDDPSYKSIIPEDLRWRNWAVDHKDGQALTGDALLSLVNNRLFPELKKLPITEDTPIRKSIVQQVFEDENNYMKDGTLLRQVINVINEIDFGSYSDRHAFGEIYEEILRSLQSAGSAGEYYTPRAVTDFIVQMSAPKLGERIADFAAGTGGFLISALKALQPFDKTVTTHETINQSLYGIEKKPLPYLLGVTNLLLHDVDNPSLFHGNSLERDPRSYSSAADKFDLILMNPPYGGGEKEGVKKNFPIALQSSETADLFMVVILYRLKLHGRAAVVLPDGFLFGADGAKRAIKEKLMKECNLHTIIRLPESVFAPYTNITTNILFFEKGSPTKKTWIYRLDLPDGQKFSSKKNPMALSHFDDAIKWWKHRTPIQDENGDKARCYSIDEIAALNYNLDLCGYPSDDEEVLPPDELIAHYKAERAKLDAQMDAALSKIEALLNSK